MSETRTEPALAMSEQHRVGRDVDARVHPRGGVPGGDEQLLHPQQREEDVVRLLVADGHVCFPLPRFACLPQASISRGRRGRQAQRRRPTVGPCSVTPECRAAWPRRRRRGRKANHSRHVTGATDEPAHSRAEALRAEFATVPRVVLLEHDEDAARVGYRVTSPCRRPCSPSTAPGGPRRAGGAGRRAARLLHVDDVRSAVQPLGFAVVLGAGAARRLTARTATAQMRTQRSAGASGPF